MARPSEQLAGRIEQAAIDLDCVAGGDIGLPLALQISLAISHRRVADALERIAAALETPAVSGNPA